MISTYTTTLVRVELLISEVLNFVLSDFVWVSVICGAPEIWEFCWSTDTGLKMRPTQNELPLERGILLLPNQSSINSAVHQLEFSTSATSDAPEMRGGNSDARGSRRAPPGS